MSPDYDTRSSEGHEGFESACSPSSRECTNPAHDHFGQIEHAENFGEPVPADDRLRCGDCGLELHYDRGVEDYRHDDPAAPACFLVPESSLPH